MSDKILYYILSALAVLIVLTVHEFAHAFAAYKLGDDTARLSGRLTLNPLKHLDIFGALCLMFFHFGWAKPVPIDARNFKKPKRDFAISALAGPLANLALAFISAFIYLLTYALLRNVTFDSLFTLNLAQNTLNFIWIFHSINVGIAIFNLIPVPPLDGSRILNVLLPDKAYFAVMKYERTIYYVLIGWLLLGDVVADFLLSIPIIAASSVLSFIARIFSLSDILSSLFSLVSDAMLWFWKLIPFLR
ncbi:MAG: site-2 protease family protein [Clostridia bacterium]|nr:site-2 protease family protein [Clostridia bacterium]